MNNKKLDSLIENKTIKSYNYFPVSEEGVPNEESDCRNTDVVSGSDKKLLGLGSIGMVNVGRGPLVTC